MEGRCAVETLAEFGCPSSTYTAKVMCIGTNMVLCAGSDEVQVFNNEDRKLTAVLQFPGPVGDLVHSQDKQLLYATCGTGVYCFNLPTLLSRVPCSIQSSDLAVLKVSSDWLAVGEEGVSSVILVGSTLLTLSQRDSVWWFTLYKTPASPQPTARSHEKIMEFSLPMVSAGQDDENDLEGNQKRGPGRRPVLICVYSSDEPPPPSSTSLSSAPEAPQGDGHFLLEPVLFKLLFGLDAALAKSPVIFCGLPDGRLCFLPLRPPGPRVRVLHSLEQPVVFFGTSVFRETGVGSPLCLVAVGQQGKVVLVRSSEGGPEEGGKVACFTEGCVTGPVVCGCVDKDHLYYSTGSDLLALNLAGGRAEKAGPGGSEEVGHVERQGRGHCGEASGKTGAALRSPISLNVCRVIALAGASRNTTGTVQLVGLSARGRLQRISLPKGREDRGAPSLPSSQVSQRIRDLLAAIGDVCERASVLKSTIQAKNQVLRHLNQVLNISCLLLADQDGEEQLHLQEKPIRCHAVARWSRLLQKDSLNLTCVLDNSSSYILEQGWTFSVAVFPLSYSHTAGGEISCRTFSFPFHNLQPGQKFEVSLPLAGAGDTSFPMTVRCSLFFSLKSLLGQEELAGLVANGDPVASHVGSDSSCVSFHIATLTVDWLDALLVGGGTTTSYNTVMSNSADAIGTDPIQAFLSTRRFRRIGRGEGRAEGASRTEGELYSARVRVSSELLRATLLSGALGVDLQGSKVAPSSLCVSVLDWLLSQGPGGGEKDLQGDRRAQGRAVVHAQGPGGHRVKLAAKEVTVGELSVEKEEEALAAVEVQVESSSMAAVCGLHHAVLSRVQSLVQRAPGKAGSTMRVQGLGLRQALQRAEALLQQMRQSCILEGLGVSLSRRNVAQPLFNVYQQLRENPLLIL